MAAMTGSVRKNPGGRYSDWLDSIEDDPPSTQSSTRVITAPLPRIVPQAKASVTTTAPLGLKVDPQDEATSAAREPSPPPSSAEPGGSQDGPRSTPRPRPQIEVQSDPMVDALLSQLPSPLDPPATQAMPEGFAVHSAGPISLPARAPQEAPKRSVMVTDSILKGTIAARAAITSISSRRARASAKVPSQASETPAAIREEPLGVPRRTHRRVVLLALLVVGGGLALLFLLLHSLGFFEPLPPPAVAKSASPPAVERLPDVPPPPPPPVAQEESRAPVIEAPKANVERSEHKKSESNAAPHVQPGPSPRPSVTATPAVPVPPDPHLDSQLHIEDK